MATLQELTRLVYEKTYNERVPVSAAADLVLAEVAPDGDAMAYLVRYGLISLLNNDVHFMRTRLAEAGSKQPGGSLFKPRSRKESNWPALSMPFEGAEGGIKSVWEFDAEDYAHQEQVSAAQSAGWQKKAEAHHMGRVLLMQNSARVTSALPDYLLRQLNTVFYEAWIGPEEQAESA